MKNANNEQSSLAATYTKLPMSFEVNYGQTDPQVKFMARGSGYTLFLTPEKAVLVLQQRGSQESMVAPLNKRDMPRAKKVKTAVLSMNLAGANPQSQMEGLEELPGKVNYFIGNDPAQWRTDIPTYAKIRYRNVYPGVDMVYYGNQGQIEYDFVVAPGADPAAISLDFQGIDQLEVDDRGDLVLHVSGEQIRFRKPTAYQENDNTRREVSISYVLKDSNRAGFNLENYDTARPLVIDPVLVYSTYLGGSGEDAGFWIAVDLSGNAYVTGITASLNFPTKNPLQPTFGGGEVDIIVTKINACGSGLVYSTYLGGSGADFGIGIDVDSYGNAYVTGITDSLNFPTKNALQPVFGGGVSDAFVTKINACGSRLVYSTYLGGSGEDAAINIAVDLHDNAYVTGSTNSLNFPTKNALQPVFGGGEFDAFVTMLNACGSRLVYSTYLGGSGQDEGVSIAVDSFTNAYVTGFTNSLNFPTQNPLQPSFGGGEFDAFVTKINAGGSLLIYSTYLGGSGEDDGFGIAVDSFGNAYITGFTNSLNFPTRNPLQPAFGGGPLDAFVTKIKACGSCLVYSTYLGGSALDEGISIAVDACGNAFVTGVVNSLNFPTKNPLQPVFGGGIVDAFVTKISSC